LILGRIFVPAASFFRSPEQDFHTAIGIGIPVLCEMQFWHMAEAEPGAYFVT